MTIPNNRIIKCMVRPDKKLALFYKPNEDTKIRAFVVTRDMLLSILHDCRNKKDLANPILNATIATQKLGFFSIEGSRTVIKRILKSLELFEVH